jgi:cell filamentation protein
VSRYAGTHNYTYPDSGVLINKADIRERAALDAFEADATSVCLLELLELHEQPIDRKFDLEHVCAIHRHLFQDANE